MLSDQRLQTLARWTAERAHTLGLSGYNTPEDVIAQAMAPALALPHLLGGAPVGPWVEIGPGAGTLGLTLAHLAPSASITLLDRRDRVAAYLELLIRRLELSNAQVLQGDASRITAPPAVGVCLRALATPQRATQIAARLARTFICIWHSASLAGYDRAPPGFALVARRLATDDGPLVASLYARDGPRA